MSADPSARRGIPDATVARLPEYLRALTGLAERGITSVSSEELAAAAGVRSAKLRKDLSHLGSYGVRGVGYEVDHLAYEISRELGLTQDWPVAIVGMGNLGHALAAYSGFATRGFRVVALLDEDPDLVGEDDRRPARCRPMADLPALVSDHGLAIGVIATPAAGCAAGLRRARRGGRALGPQLRALRARGARRRRRPQGRPVDRAADPRLPRAAQGARGAGVPAQGGGA